MGKLSLQCETEVFSCINLQTQSPVQIALPKIQNPLFIGFSERKPIINSDTYKIITKLLIKFLYIKICFFCNYAKADKDFSHQNGQR
jgi:hypothetical protein